MTEALKTLKNVPFVKKVQRNYIALKIDTKFEGKQTCVFKNDMRNLAIFQKLKNSDFILESKMAKLNQNKNSNQPDRPDSVLKIRFTFEINE